ncbi:MAG: exonuclease domain-containing protein [Hydrogenoanaerobacterium sp.]
MDFIAIDFETANSERTSACSLGIAVVEDNVIVDTKSFLIKPVPFYFHPFNVGIHGITDDDVKDAPVFSELWQELLPILENKIVVAHNASFDISVLRRTLEYYNIILPRIDILCTYRLSQHIFPNAGSYRLNVICKALGIELDHHDALSDASGCAKVLCYILDKYDIETLDDLRNQFNVSPGYIREQERYSPCKLPHIPKLNKKKVIHELPELDVTYIDDDFAGKNFVFTGTLLSMSRSNAHEIVALGGGTPQNSVTKATNYLVVGLQDYRTLHGELSSKMKKAYCLKEAGQDIQVIVEDEFMAMIDDELYNKCGFMTVI